MRKLDKLSCPGRSGSLVKAAGVVAVALMVMAVVAMPAVACNCVTEDKVGGNNIVDNFIIENEHGFGKVRSLLGVITDKDVISVIKDLHSKGYNLQYDRTSIQRIRPKENESQEVSLVIIPAESKNSPNSAQVIFASNGEMTCVANAIIEDGENYRRIEVYEIDNGTENKYVVENRAGTISIDGKTIITGSQIRSGTDCDICLSVCGVISAAGCGLSGFLVCTAACAGFAGPTCPAICAGVWAVFCWYSTPPNCDTCCQSYCE
ncbi:MAG: hypothetical protein DRI69_07245 [Bacteroidetes bacterium]|nr:MAG: hypothetical protein DRI69_07245 [Bacteroidota bacterium]